ncbi:MAG: Arc family DNA-binding protein [Magnetococcales bacterium]|nr:Arc family DNA-binding protein [Magnetococcales bacterium]
MARSDPQFKLRLPQELKKKIEEAAQKNDRSMNAEIIARLKSSLNESSKSNASSGEDIGELSQVVRQVLDDSIQEFAEQRREETLSVLREFRQFSFFIKTLMEHLGTDTVDSIKEKMDTQK